MAVKVEEKGMTSPFGRSNKAWSDLSGGHDRERLLEWESLPLQPAAGRRQLHSKSAPAITIRRCYCTSGTFTSETHGFFF